MKQRLQFFFDSGSGICLWDEGGSTEADDLPLSSDTKQRILEVDNLHLNVSTQDTIGTKRSLVMRNEFITAAHQLLERIRLELGPEYEVVECMKIDEYLPVEQFE